jgi:hypothetical protein
LTPSTGDTENFRLVRFGRVHWPVCREDQTRPGEARRWNGETKGKQRNEENEGMKERGNKGKWTCIYLQSRSWFFPLHPTVVRAGFSHGPVREGTSPTSRKRGKHEKHQIKRRKIRKNISVTLSTARMGGSAIMLLYLSYMYSSGCPGSPRHAMIVEGLPGFRMANVGGISSCGDSVVLWVLRDAMVVGGLTGFRMGNLFGGSGDPARCHGR